MTKHLQAVMLFLSVTFSQSVTTAEERESLPLELEDGQGGWCGVSPTLAGPAARRVLFTRSTPRKRRRSRDSVPCKRVRFNDKVLECSDGKMAESRLCKYPEERRPIDNIKQKLSLLEFQVATSSNKLRTQVYLIHVQIVNLIRASFTESTYFFNTLKEQINKCKELWKVACEDLRKIKGIVEKMERSLLNVENAEQKATYHKQFEKTFKFKIIVERLDEIFNEIIVILEQKIQKIDKAIEKERFTKDLWTANRDLLLLPSWGDRIEEIVKDSYIEQSFGKDFINALKELQFFLTTVKNPEEWPDWQ